MAAKKKATSKKTSSKKVATTEKTELAPAAGAIDFGADAGGGMEGTDKDSFAIPFLQVLHKQSPQCEEGDSAYIDGAKGGMLMNSVTQTLFDGEEGLVFLPCAYQRRFLRWAPRGSDRGFLGEFLPEEVAVMRSEGVIVELEGKLLAADADGNVSEKKSDVFQDTRLHFGLVLAEDCTTSQVLLALKSTQIKKSKQLMMLLSQAKVPDAAGALKTPPTWMNKIRITTVPESNDQGSWHGLRFTAEGHVTDPAQYAEGKAFNEAIAAGEAGSDFAAESEESTAQPEKF